MYLNLGKRQVKHLARTFLIQKDVNLLKTLKIEWSVKKIKMVCEVFRLCMRLLFFIAQNKTVKIKKDASFNLSKVPLLLLNVVLR